MSGIGRLAGGPDPLLFELLYEQQLFADRREVLPYLLAIDGAHVVMLARTGLLPGAVASSLLAVNRDLLARLEAGEPVLEPPPSHRGLYFLYERLYIDRLGAEAGGAAHLARSRNDINSAVTRLRLRDSLLSMLGYCGELVSAAIAQAQEHAGTVMSGFTHMQPAQPTTLGHYLAAVTWELTRAAERLAGGFDEIDRSPIGAAAGQGTALAIDRELTASLLGFGGVVANSLDAVASRDYAVQTLSGLAILGTTLTRLSSDLQAWGSNAYGFLSWPDRLVSTSSMMPQKRNAFVLENIRGQAVRPAGALTAILAGLKGTPFSNSVEVSSEAVSHLWPALAAMEKAVRLTALMLNGLTADPQRMLEFLEREETTMTTLADELVVRHGLSFRSAHEVVGQFLRERPAGKLEPGAVKKAIEDVLSRVIGRTLELDEDRVARALDPVACAHAAEWGGGPAPGSVRAQLRDLEERRTVLAARVDGWRRRRDEAAGRLAAAIDELRSRNTEREG